MSFECYLHVSINCYWKLFTFWVWNISFQIFLTFRVANKRSNVSAFFLLILFLCFVILHIDHYAMEEFFGPVYLRFWMVHLFFFPICEEFSPAISLNRFSLRLTCILVPLCWFLGLFSWSYPRVFGHKCHSFITFSL